MAARFTPSRPFRPLPFARGPHAQTILAQFLRPTRGPAVNRVRLDTPDDDFLDVDCLQAPKDAPHLLLIHGLEGSSRSGYVVAMQREAQKRGWGAWSLNFRSCSGEPNRAARSYCSGETADPLFVLEKMRADGITGPILGVGFSLGGNVVLKLLGDTGEAAPLAAAVAVSTPYDLATCADTIDASSGLTFLYKEVFLRSLKAKALQKARLHPGAFDVAAVRRARGIRPFDDALTAPLYGYKDATDYYAQCSSARVLERIRRPTLLISAKDDPIAPLHGEPERSRNPLLHWIVTAEGGHVGFIEGAAPSHDSFWAEQVSGEFLAWSLAQQA